MANMKRPSNKTGQAELDQFNIAIRQSPAYQQFLAKNGLSDTGQGVHMSKGQRKAWAAELQAAGLPLESGMEIDAGGNIDHKGFNWKKWGPIIAAGAATGGLGLAGVGPLAGIMGTSNAAAGAIPSLAAGIPSTAAQVWGPMAGATAAGGTTAAAGAGMGLKDLLIGKGMDFGLGALQGALNDGGGGSQTREAFKGTPVAQSRVLEHFLNALNVKLGESFAGKGRASDYNLEGLMPPGGAHFGLRAQAPQFKNAVAQPSNGDFSKQVFSPQGPGASVPQLNPNAPLTPEQIAKMLGGK